jgi:translation elongation factor EF-Ts
MKLQIKTLNDLLQSNGYQIYESDTLLNIQYHIINTDKDIDAMIDANTNGDFGCTHSEFIDTWREYLNTLTVYDPAYNEVDEMNDYDIDQQTYNSIAAEIDKCEAYHIEQNTIDQFI